MWKCSRFISFKSQNESVHGECLIHSHQTRVDMDSLQMKVTCYEHILSRSQEKGPIGSLRRLQIKTDFFLKAPLIITSQFLSSYQSNLVISRKSIIFFKVPFESAAITLSYNFTTFAALSLRVLPRHTAAFGDWFFD